VWVCWCADSEFYQGTIVDYNRESGKHTVQYSSRLVEELHLPVEMVSFDAEKPTLHSPELELSPQFIKPGQVWQQGSGGSVDSIYVDDQALLMALPPPPALPTAAAQLASSSKPLGRTTGQRRPRDFLGLREAEAAIPTDTEAPPPKRALSAPAAVLLAAVASAAAHEAEAAAQLQSNATTQMGVMPPSASPLTPVRLGSVGVETPAAPFLPTSTCETSLAGHNPVKALPPPPRLDFLDGDASKTAVPVACRWLNELALHLDQDLSKLILQSTSTADEDKLPQSMSVATNLTVVNASVSSRFQALVASIRASPALVEGVFEAMISRYDFFRDVFAVQRVKMAELVVALLDEAGRGFFHELKAD